MTGLIKTPTGDSDRVSFKKKAGEILSALKIVYLSDKDTAALATNTAFDKSKAVGMTLGAATVGVDVTIVQFGQVLDPFFTFTANVPLYLGINGAIIDVAPTSGFVTIIGHSIGSGGIFIDIQEPIELC